VTTTQATSFALDPAGLLDPAVTVSSCRANGEMLVIGASTVTGSAQSRSPSTLPRWPEAPESAGRCPVTSSPRPDRGIRRRRLRRGSQPTLSPARFLYASARFIARRPFSNCRPSENSTVWRSNPDRRAAEGQPMSPRGHNYDAIVVADPGAVCRPAIGAGLVVHRADPLNAETPLAALAGQAIVPADRFYIRSHSPIPAVDPRTWQLRVGGLAGRLLALSLADLQRMPAQTVVATLECAGNGRAALDPPVPGEQWGWARQARRRGPACRWPGRHVYARSLIGHGCIVGSVDFARRVVTVRRTVR
jgi:Oxidoreductase molybdopterin binding domain